MLQSMGSQRVQHDSATENKYFISDIYHFYCWLEYKVDGLPSADIIQVTLQ